MPTRLRTVLLGVTTVHRERVTWRLPLVSAGVTAGLTVLCVVAGHQEAALAVALGAWFAGIANTGEAAQQRWRTMLWATLWLAVAALVGGVIAPWDPLGIVAVAVMALACGFAGALGPRGILIGTLTLVVYAIFAGSPPSDHGVVATAALVGVGGLIQTAVAVIPALARRGTGSSTEPARPAAIATRLAARANLGDDMLRHAVRLSIAMIAATAIADISRWPHDYWIPLSVAWMARPDQTGTATRVVQRIAGTLIGILAAAILIDGLDQGPYALSAYVLAGVFVGLALRDANYPLAVVGITVVVISLFALAGEPVADTAPFRIAGTLVAGAITVLASFIWPSRGEPVEHA